MKGLKSIGIVLFGLLTFAYSVTIVGLLSNKFDISYQGFAVDNEENFYLGFYSGKIKKINDGKVLKTISAQTSRGYDFTITENDTLYITCGDVAYFVDLDGNILEKITDNIQPFYKYRYNKSVFVASDGTKYERKINFGKTKFIKHQDQQEITVYEMPLEDYLAKLILVVGSVIIYGTIIVFIIKQRRPIRGQNTRQNTRDGSLCQNLE